MSKNKNQSGSTLAVASFALTIAIVVGLVGWKVWSNNKDEKNTNISVQSSAPQKASKSEKSNKTKSSDSAMYLSITQWGVKLATSDLTRDAEYAIKDDHTLFISTKTYSAKLQGSCGVNGSTGYLARGKAGYDYLGFGRDIANEEGAVKVGDMYYVWVSPQAPCAEPTDANVAILDVYQPALAALAKTVIAE